MVQCASVLSYYFCLRSNICSSSIHHVCQWNPVKSQLCPVKYIIFSDFPKFIMFPSDVPNFPEIHVFFHVFPSLKNHHLARYLPRIFQENPSEIQVNFPGIRPGRYVFALMPSMSLQPDVVSFSAAISSCEKMGQWQQAHGVDIGWGPRNGGRVQLLKCLISGLSWIAWTVAWKKWLNELWFMVDITN